MAKKMPWDDDGNTFEVKEFSVKAIKPRAGAALPVIDPIATYDPTKDVDIDKTPEQRLQKTANKWATFAQDTKPENAFHPALGTVASSGDSYRSGTNYRPTETAMIGGESAFKKSSGTSAFSNSSAPSAFSRSSSSSSVSSGGNRNKDILSQMNSINSRLGPRSDNNSGSSGNSYNAPTPFPQRPQAQVMPSRPPVQAMQSRPPVQAMPSRPAPIQSQAPINGPALSKASPAELKAKRQETKNRLRTFSGFDNMPTTTFVGADPVAIAGPGSNGGSRPASRASPAPAPAQRAMPQQFQQFQQPSKPSPAPMQTAFSSRPKPVVSAAPINGPALSKASPAELKAKRQETKNRLRTFSGFDNMPTTTFVGADPVAISGPGSNSSSSSNSNSGSRPVTRSMTAAASTQRVMPQQFQQFQQPAKPSPAPMQTAFSSRPKPAASPAPINGPALSKASPAELKAKRQETKNRLRTFSGFDNMPTTTFVGADPVAISGPGASSGSRPAPRATPAPTPAPAFVFKPAPTPAATPAPAPTAFTQRPTAVSQSVSKEVEWGSTVPDSSRRDRKANEGWPTRDGAKINTAPVTSKPVEKNLNTLIVKRIKCPDGVIRTLTIDPYLDDIVEKINAFCKEGGLEEAKLQIQKKVQESVNQILSK